MVGYATGPFEANHWCFLHTHRRTTCDHITIHLFGFYKMTPLLHIFDILANDRNPASDMCARNVIQYLWLVAACHSRVGGNSHNV